MKSNSHSWKILVSAFSLLVLMGVGCKEQVYETPSDAIDQVGSTSSVRGTLTAEELALRQEARRPMAEKIAEGTSRVAIMTDEERTAMDASTPGQDHAKTPDSQDDVVAEVGGDYHGVLVDVSGGTNSGSVQGGYENGVFGIVADFSLQIPSGSDFYEGWLVRRGDNMSVLSTGRIDYNADENIWLNIYGSGQDLRDHNFYVVTLEQDDGDPAPAEHILEGLLGSENEDDPS